MEKCIFSSDEEVSIIRKSMGVLILCNIKKSQKPLECCNKNVCWEWSFWWDVYQPTNSNIMKKNLCQKVN